MKVINFWAGPGAGKSTTAAGLFFEMKKQGYEVELVTEYAKDMTWEERFNVLTDQLYVLAKQNRRIHRLKNKVDWVITDSPILMGLMYAPNNYYETFKPFITEVWNSYENVSFLLSRDFDYNPIGRNQTYQEALQIDSQINEFLDTNNIDYHLVTNDPSVDRISYILSIVKNMK